MWFGHVGDMPWTKEQIQAQAARPRRADGVRTTQALASLPTGRSRTESLSMSCCKCGGDELAAHPTYAGPAPACVVCDKDCTHLPFSPLYNPYGHADAARQPAQLQPQQAQQAQLRQLQLQQQPPQLRQFQALQLANDDRHSLGAAPEVAAAARGEGAPRRGAGRGRVRFFKEHERGGYPTRGMLELNNIIRGSKYFKAPPASPDVYARTSEMRAYADPLVQLS